MTIELYDANKSVLGYINVRNYITGTPVQGVDYSAEFQQAIDDCAAQQKSLWVPAGKYGISATVNVTCSIFGPMTRFWDNCATLYPTMSDGSACLKYVKQQQLTLAGLRIYYATTDPAGALDAVGIDYGYTAGQLPLEDYASSRGTLDMISIHGLKVGFKAGGWINNYQRMFVTSCQTGAIIEQSMDNVMDFAFENCNKALQFEGGGPCLFTRLSDEGAYGSVASTIKASRGVTIAYYRAEQTNRGAVPFLVIGGDGGSCENINILGGTVDGPADNVPAIQLDNCVSPDIRMGYSIGSNRYPFSRTANTKNSSSLIETTGGWPIAETRSLSRQQVVNLLPNSKMLGTRLGGTVSLVRSSIAEETTTKIHESAFKVTCTVGQSFSHCNIWYADSDFVASVVDEELTLGVWIYTPDLPALEGTGVGPVVALKSYNGTTDTDFAYTQLGWHHLGVWSFLHCTGTVPSDCQALVVRYSPNSSGVVMNNSEYVIFGETILAKGDCWREIINGNWAPSDRGGYVGQAVEFNVSQGFAATLQSDAEPTWKTGDRLTFTDPSAGGSMGEVCTAGGIGVAAVWKTYGAIGA